MCSTYIKWHWLRIPVVNTVCLKNYIKEYSLQKWFYKQLMHRLMLVLLLLIFHKITKIYSNKYKYSFPIPRVAIFRLNSFTRPFQGGKSRENPRNSYDSRIWWNYYTFYKYIHLHYTTNKTKNNRVKLFIAQICEFLLIFREKVSFELKLLEHTSNSVFLAKCP